MRAAGLVGRGLTVATAIGLVGVLGASTAGAGVRGACGNSIQIRTPGSAKEGAHQANNVAQWFAEQRNKKLTKTITVDAVKPGNYDSKAKLPSPAPTIKVGTAVDSYMIYADPIGQPTRPATFTVRFSWSSAILGVIVRDSRLAATDKQVGGVHTLYPATKNRGLELYPRYDAVRIVDSRTVSIDFSTNTWVDEVRVIVAASKEPDLRGYNIATPGWRVAAYGSRSVFGKTPTGMKGRVVAGAESCAGGGYWLAGSDGSIRAFGSAFSYGSMAGKRLAKPVVGMATTPTGKGYWMVASDGGIFRFGDAKFYGSRGGKPLFKPIAGIAATPSGKGYWMVASDGGLFTFGDAHFYGSLGNKRITKRIVAMAATPSSRGYLMVANDGTVYRFGDARFYGSVARSQLRGSIVSIKTTPTARGYWLLSSTGRVYRFGDAQALGDTATTLRSGATIF